MRFVDLRKRDALLLRDGLERLGEIDGHVVERDIAVVARHEVNRQLVVDKVSVLFWLHLIGQPQRARPVLELQDLHGHRDGRRFDRLALALRVVVLAGDVERGRVVAVHALDAPDRQVRREAPRAVPLHAL